MAKTRMTVMICDNPQCRSRQAVEDKDEVTGYIFGKGRWADSGGGGLIPEIFACSEECIAPAVLAVVNEAKQ